MSRTSPRALVLMGDGINCERETAEALSQAGFHAQIRHLNDLIAEEVTNDQVMADYSAIAIPGGFSFGDHLNSGKVLALKIDKLLKWDFSKFVQNGGLVIGICNGFQALMRLQVFGSNLSITHNDSGHFINRWVRVQPEGTRCVWLKDLGTIDLPVRHGEGRVVLEADHSAESLDKLTRQEMLCLRYQKDVNGSAGQVAGLCDSTGRIFGLMPHPEAFVRWTAHPSWTDQPDSAGSAGAGLRIFENAAKEARASL